MTRVYIVALFITAFTIAFVGATFSILGLVKLFAGASFGVIFMASALELAKLVTTGFLYRYWGHINKLLRYYLVFAVVSLVIITSVGIFGYLSSAYQIASVSLKEQNLKLASLKNEEGRLQTRIDEINRFINEIPNSRISRKFEFKKQYEKEMKDIRKNLEDNITESEAIKFSMVQTNTKIGPAIFLADSLHMEVDQVVKYFILLFVLIFDPLAVCLVFCLNLAIRVNEKYRGNEFKIGALSVSTPVDHRFKKSA